MKQHHREPLPTAIGIIIVLMVCMAFGMFVSWVCPDCIKSNEWKKKRSEPTLLEKYRERKE